MLVVFSPIFVADTKIIFRFDFAAHDMLQILKNTRPSLKLICYA